MLVVEDKDGIAALACGILEKFGYRWAPASNAEEAVRQALSQLMAVFSDFIRPGPIDGIAALERLPEFPMIGAAASSLIDQQAVMLALDFL